MAKDKLKCICASREIKLLLPLVERISLQTGELSVAIDGNRMAHLLNADPDDMMQSALSVTAPFQLRKRGVETKLIFADAPQNRDETLIKNIAKAHQWFEHVKAGATLSEIAKADGTSNRRVQQMIDLAFLAPDILRDVLNGSGPMGLTSDWCMRHALPADWSEQRALLATL